MRMNNGNVSDNVMLSEKIRHKRAYTLFIVLFTYSSKTGKTNLMLEVRVMISFGRGRDWNRWEGGKA